MIISVSRYLPLFRFWTACVTPASAWMISATWGKCPPTLSCYLVLTSAI